MKVESKKIVTNRLKYYIEPKDLKEILNLTLAKKMNLENTSITFDSRDFLIVTLIEGERFINYKIKQVHELIEEYFRKNNILKESQDYLYTYLTSKDIDNKGVLTIIVTIENRSTVSDNFEQGVI